MTSEQKKESMKPLSRSARLRNYAKGKGKRSQRLRERASLSFFIVIIFFAVFGIIVVAEIFFIDEKHSGMYYGDFRRKNIRSDYEDVLSDDYFVYRGFDDNLGLFLREEKALKDDKPSDNSVFSTLPSTDKTKRKGTKERTKTATEVSAHAKNSISKLVQEKRSLNEFSPYPNSSSGLQVETNNLTAVDGEWQTVKGTRFKFYVFSAFYDRREERSIRIIGATKTRSPEKVWCKFWYSNGTSLSVQAHVKIIRENWNLKYSACFILCPLHSRFLKWNMTVPASVSVVRKFNGPPSNHLLVRNTDIDLANASKNMPEFGQNIAVCVKPLHFSYNQVLQMLEFLELNALLGIRHFTMYNHTIGPDVNCILREYIQDDIITLLPWNLNMVSQKEIRTEGLFAALNDCLYRNMYRYRFVVMIDLDEFVVPRYNDTLGDLVEFLSKKINTKTMGSYSFQNAFFYLQWADDPTTSSLPNLVTLRKTRRRAKFHPHKQRSKYMCRPDFVVEAGNHFVWEYLPGHGTFQVPSDSGFLHHYRVCEFGGDDCIKTQSVLDRTTLRYKDRLIDRITNMLNRIKDKCHLEDLNDKMKQS